MVRVQRMQAVLAVVALSALTAASVPSTPILRDDIRQAMGLEARGRELNLLLAARARRAGNASEAAQFEQAAGFNQKQFLDHVAMLERNVGEAALREALDATIAQRALYASAIAHARAVRDNGVARHFEGLRTEAAKQRDLLGGILKKRLASK